MATRVLHLGHLVQATEDGAPRLFDFLLFASAQRVDVLRRVMSLYIACHMSMRTVSWRILEDMIEMDKEGTHDARRLVQAAEEYCQQEMAGQDGSHDWFHVNRVRRLALLLAKQEAEAHPGVAIDLLVVELAALLHDVKDWKYAKSLGAAYAGPEAVRAFLEDRGPVCGNVVSQGQVDHIVAIVAQMGWKSELPSLADQKTTTVVAEAKCETLERFLVQDADRLDAMGAMGIARAFTFGGSRGQPIYDPTVASRTVGKDFSRDHYMGIVGGDGISGQDKPRLRPTLNHFDEKLLNLVDSVCTEAGKKLAKERHAWMQMFVCQLLREAAV